ncbi:glycerate kinase [Variovorax paradoxus]|uniref:Glycerate kinase n=1 Tax=Variovorax paradoxus TaxID=34073 RepID=A0A6I6HIC6_VARPD|nr:glycerate kinase [Variovorax paradoxus]QGW80307.1 glycerate kinase [Variovorax paradoxus]
MRAMNFQKLLVPVGAIVLLGLAWRSGGWGGVALAGGVIVMFLLMHFTRAMQVLKRAADRPVGYVASSVMLNAKLKKGVTLMHVIAMTRALGELRSPQDEQPELYRWTDTGGSYVDAVFKGGKLQSWTLTRPEAEPDSAPPSEENTAG